MDTKSPSQFAQSETAPHTWLSGRIVVGIDGSEHSTVALRHAEQLALMGGARIDVIIAWQLPVGYGPVYGPITYSPGDEAQTALDETVTAVFGEDVPDNVTTFLSEGPAAEILIDASRDADLLVVGGRGRGALSSALLGTISSECAERATCPVLVVHHPRETAAHHS